MAYEPEDTPRQRAARRDGFEAGFAWVTRDSEPEWDTLLALRGTAWAGLAADPVDCPTLHREFVRLGARARDGAIFWPREPFSEGFLGGVVAATHSHGSRIVA